MYLIVGLGNPGLEYMNTRHNAGFDAIDILAKMYNVSIDRVKFKGIYGEIKINNEKVLLLKPTTYMNLSGDSVVLAANYYKIPPENIIVIYDDISLDVGRLRVRTKGSAGGHNGIKSLISCLGTENFPRVRVGVGSPQGNLADYVLGKFSKEDRNKVEEVLEVAAKASETIVNEGVEKAMNKFNSYKVD